MLHTFHASWTEDLQEICHDITDALNKHHVSGALVHQFQDSHQIQSENQWNHWAQWHRFLLIHRSKSLHSLEIYTGIDSQVKPSMNCLVQYQVTESVTVICGLGHLRRLCSRLQRHLGTDRANRRRSGDPVDVLVCFALAGSISVSLDDEIGTNNNNIQ